VVEEPVPARDEQVRLIAAGTGGLVALVDSAQATILELPGLVTVAEIGLPTGDCDVAFAGALLIVLARAVTSDSTLHVIDPRGPKKLGSLKLRGTARIAAIADDHVLVAGISTAVVEVGRLDAGAQALPLRGVMTAAGTSEGRFLLCMGGALEEWDPATRKPARRLRVDQAIEPWLVGGNEHRVWIVSRKQPAQLDVVELAKKTSRRVELPEPVARVVPHRRGDIVVALGESTRAYLVFIDRQDPIVPLEGLIGDAAWLGRSLTLAVRSLAGQISLVSVGGDEPSPQPRPPPPASSPAPPPLRVEPPPPVEAKQPEATPPKWTRDDISSRLAAWRERVTDRRADDPAPTIENVTAIHPGGWRHELAGWARAVCARSYRELPRLDYGSLDEVTQRLALVERDREAVALLYGAYLNGIDHVAPIALAPAVGWRWQDALGGGALAASGALRWRRGQIRLASEVIAAIDERPPLHGAIVGEGTLDRIVAIVAPAEVPLAEVAAWAKLGVVLVPDRKGTTPAFFLEARARGLAPIVRAGAPLPARGVVVVTEPADAPVEIVATWP